MRRRVIYSNNGTSNDLSVDMFNYHGGTSTIAGFVAAEDAIYIGNLAPFNHLYIKMGGTVNAETSSMSVQYWSGAWTDAVEVLDETATAGVSLAKSGFISWVPNKSTSWVRESTNYSGESVTGLTDLVIYDMYWIKLSFSADLTADIVLSWAGQVFSDDNDLGTEYADLLQTGLLGAWESGKTTWEEQHVLAASLLVDDIIYKGLIDHNGQILNRFDLRPASTCRVAQLIYSGLGDDFKDQMLEAKKEYERRINIAIPKIDINNNGILDIDEQRFVTGKLYR